MALDEKNLKKAIAELHAHKKKFSQAYDLIVTLKDLDLKKPEEQVEFFALLPKTTKLKRICALVGPELIDEAKTATDRAIQQVEFEKMDKAALRKIAREYDFFLGQANIMPKIAGAFGKILGPRGKMPNPKAGCIVPPKAALKPIVEKLQRTVKVSAKKSPNIQVRVASQDMTEAEVAQNILTLYDQIIHHLPREENNVKSVLIKTTMGKPVKVK